MTCTCMVVPDELVRVEKSDCPVHGVPVTVGGGALLTALDAALFEYAPDPGVDDGLDRLGWLSGLLDMVREGPDCLRDAIEVDADAHATMQSELDHLLAGLREVVRLRRAFHREVTHAR